MTIQLPEYLRSFVDEQIATGRFRDEAELAVAAISRLQDDIVAKKADEVLKGIPLEAIRDKLNSAIASLDANEGKPIDEVFDQLEARFARKGSSA